MNAREELEKIKKQTRVYHISAILLLAVNAVVWFSVLFGYYISENGSWRVLLIAGIGCISFLVAIIIVCYVIERRMNRKLKIFAGEFAGIVSDEDRALAKILQKRWKKVYIKSIKIFFDEFRKETYPFGMKMLSDLGALTNGVKIELSIVYTQLAEVPYDEASDRNAELINDIVTLLTQNSYVLD